MLEAGGLMLEAGGLTLEAGGWVPVREESLSD